MKLLLSYCVIAWYERELAIRKKTLVDYLNKYKLDGIEQFIYGMEMPFTDYRKNTVGVHLAFWPSWFKFWREDGKYSLNNNVQNKDEWLSMIRQNINIALEQKPEYLVWHVAESSLAEAFTFSFEHDDLTVSKAAAEVFNCVASSIPENVCVLFENLWWPGLRLLSKETVRAFFAQIKKKNVGIMLDTGHLLNTNKQLKNEKQAIEYIDRCLINLGKEIQKIKGVHLNLSLSGKYQDTFPKGIPEKFNAELMTRHIASIDQHRPFTISTIRKIVARIKPDYLVHELNYNDFDELESFLKKQMFACGYLAK